MGHQFRPQCYAQRRIVLNIPWHQIGWIRRHQCPKEGSGFPIVAVSTRPCCGEDAARRKTRRSAEAISCVPCRTRTGPHFSRYHLRTGPCQSRYLLALFASAAVTNASKLSRRSCCVALVLTYHFDDIKRLPHQHLRECQLNGMSSSRVPEWTSPVRYRLRSPQRDPALFLTSSRRVQAHQRSTRWTSWEEGKTARRVTQRGTFQQKFMKRVKFVLPALDLSTKV